MSEPSHHFPFSIRWTGGREGLASASDVDGELAIASPPEFGGPGRQWTPEHLFIGAATSCWMTTFLTVAELSKLEVAAIEASADGVVEKQEDRRFAIPRIVLRPKVTVTKEADRDRALRLIEKAEGACLVARSMKTEVILEPEVVVAAEGSSHD